MQQGGHELGDPGVAADVGDQRAVQLHRLDRQVHQGAQVGVAGAEVVQGHAHAPGGQALDVAAGQGHVLQQEGLGDLDGEGGGRQVGLGQAADQLAGEAGVEQVAGADVAGHQLDEALGHPGGGALAGGVEHRLVDGPDQAQLLGHGHEGGGGQHALLGMVPAGEDLDAHHPGGRGIHHRLVPGLDLAGGYGPAQLVLEGAAPLGLGPQVGVEDAVAAPAAGLHPVEGHVGEALKVRGVRGVVREHRHPHRGARGDLAAVDHLGLGDDVHQPLGPAGHVPGVGDHRELVAAEAGGDLAGGAVGRQPGAELGQQQVAGVVAEVVVQGLEAVEVDHEQGHRLAGFPGRLEAFAEQGGEGAAVEQAGEGIGLRQPQRQRALGLQRSDARGELRMGVQLVGHGPGARPHLGRRRDLGRNEANGPLSGEVNGGFCGRRSGASARGEGPVRSAGCGQAVLGSAAGSSIWFSHLATTALATELPTTLVAERPMSRRWSTARIRAMPASGRSK